MNSIKKYVHSSIGKKQIVAITGIGLVLFLVAHLAGNLLLFSGPESLNSYAKNLHELGPILWVMRLGLIATFLIHIVFTAQLVIANRKARQQNYNVKQNAERSFATRTMPITGSIIAGYLILHLMDYTWQINSISTLINGKDLGVYGMVVNSFLCPVRSLVYVIAMLAIGTHLSHAIQSAAQSFGIHHSNITPKIKFFSTAIGWLLALGFSSLPIYVFIRYYLCEQFCIF